DDAKVAVHEVERRDAVVVVADLAHLGIGQRTARAEHAPHLAHEPPSHVEIVDAHVNEEAAAARRPEKLNRRWERVLRRRLEDDGRANGPLLDLFPGGCEGFVETPHKAKLEERAVLGDGGLYGVTFVDVERQR